MIERGAKVPFSTSKINFFIADLQDMLCYTVLTQSGDSVRSVLTLTIVNLWRVTK